ncbi:hypothetical protein ACEQ8H_002443 [Pleosporales sp. CAS-2024a]
MASSKFNLPTHFRDWNASFAPSSLKSGERSRAKTPLWKRPLFLGIAGAVVIILVIVIAVPLAVLLPKKKHRESSTILLPLYIYPKDNATWSPLFDTLQARPELNYTIIINPSSGPGNASGPDNAYSAALKQLSTYPNVQKIGYVRTGYATRNLSDVVSEVNKYSAWAAQDQAFEMDGIFFDESPHQYSQNAVDFMLSATRTVKSASGIQGQKTVVRNPGVIPDPRFSDANTDITVVFEESYTQYAALQLDLAALKDGRAHHCYMVHSVPSMSLEQLRQFTRDLSKRAQYLFVTNNSDNIYESFGSDWANFTQAMP